MGGALSARSDPTAERFELASPDGYFAALRSRAPGTGRHFTPFGLPLNFAAARFRLAKSNFKAQYRSSPVCKIEPVASTNWWLGASLALPGKASAILKKSANVRSVRSGKAWPKISAVNLNFARQPRTRLRTLGSYRRRAMDGV